MGTVPWFSAVRKGRVNSVRGMLVRITVRAVLCTTVPRMIVAILIVEVVLTIRLDVDLIDHFVQRPRFVAYVVQIASRSVAGHLISIGAFRRRFVWRRIVAVEIGGVHVVA